MAHDPVHDKDVAEVTHLTAKAASALIRGDVRRYLTFIGHAGDYTLLQPFGGEPRRGFDSSDEALEGNPRNGHASTPTIAALIGSAQYGGAKAARLKLHRRTNGTVHSPVTIFTSSPLT